MADQSSPLQFEDVPLEEARRMGRGPRMEPLLYDTLRKKVQSLSTDAARFRLGPEITPQPMKSYILRVARELNAPVTVWRVPGGVIFWRSSEEDLRHRPVRRPSDCGVASEERRVAPEVAGRGTP